MEPLLLYTVLQPIITNLLLLQPPTSLLLHDSTELRAAAHMTLRVDKYRS